MRKLIVLATSLVVLGTAAAGVAIADTGLELQAPAHRHYINGREVGPRYCDNENLRDAFTQFHANIHSHSGVTGEIGDPAPGLHGPSQNTIESGPCVPVP
jgi:hypothetical protein